MTMILEINITDPIKRSGKHNRKLCQLPFLVPITGIRESCGGLTEAIWWTANIILVNRVLLTVERSSNN